MSFGLTNDPSTFMRLMNEFLKPYLSKFVIVYLDDILIFTTEEEQVYHVRAVLQRLKEEKLLVNLKKCSFMKEELVYLGFVISSTSLEMDLKKVKSIVDWPSPSSKFEARSFHGLARFYRNFIQYFSGICAPITETMRGDKIEFFLTIAAEKSFNILKEKLREKHVLALPNFEKVFELYCDANVHE